MSAHADCSIIVLAHNREDITRHCVAGILASDPLPRQLIMVDNGSSDGTAAFLASMSDSVYERDIDLVLCRNDDQVGCSEARNRAWDRADSTYVVLLDNDCIVRSQNWLKVFCRTMDSAPAIGVLGPRLLYPNSPHLIQCAGVDISPLGRIRFRGRGEAADAAPYRELRDTHALISACWIMPNRFRDELGGLDTQFHPLQFEDFDYCMRITGAGYRCVYTPEVEMYHFEGTTSGSVGRERYIRTIAKNSALFRKKWKARIEKLPADDGDFSWADMAAMGLSETLDLTIV